jgi:hypothetical protein
MVEEVMETASANGSPAETVTIEASHAFQVPAIAVAPLHEPVAINLREAAVNGVPKAHPSKSESQLALFGRVAG